MASEKAKSISKTANLLCLLGYTFVFTGQLEDMTRDEAYELVASHGGRCVRGVSSRTTHLVTGEAGLVKGQAVISESTKKVQSRPGITKLDEQGFYAFIKEEAERLAKAETERLAKADQAEP